MSFDWTDERIAELTRMQAEGTSSALIANEMGITRNAVLGKIHRLGLATTKIKHARPQHRPRSPGKRGEDGGIASKLSHRRRRKGQNFVATAIRHRDLMEDPGMEQQTPDVFDQAIPIEQRRTLLELTAETCRWPVGEGAELFFCGAVPVEGFSYCGPHCRRAFAGAPDGTRRRPFIAMRTRAA